MALTQDIHVELIEKELIRIELTTIDVIPRKTYITELEDITILNPVNGQVLVYENGVWVNDAIDETELAHIILNETPVNVNSLPSARFSVVNPFVSGKIQVFLNGMKIHNSEIIFHSSTEFSYPLDIIATDTVEVAYIKQ